MKNIYLVVFLFIYNNVVFPQDYFNFRFDYNSSTVWDGASNLFVLPDGYIVGGGTGFVENYFFHRIGLMKIDFQGNRIFTKLYGDTTAELYLGDAGSLFQLNDTTIIATGSRNSYPPGNLVHQEGLVIWLNSNFDTLFTKHYGEIIEPYDTQYIFNQGKITYDGKIIAVGTINPYYSTTSQFAVLMKLNTDGTILWEKKYQGDMLYTYGFSVICTNDGGYLIGGYEYYGPGDPIIIKVDSLGDKQWIKKLGGYYDEDQSAMVTNSLDGYIVAGAVYSDQWCGSSAEQGRIHICKFTNNGDTLWDKKYGQGTCGNFMYNIRTCSDGTMVAVGTRQYVNETIKEKGWMLKINNDGDSLWYREYELLQGSESINYLYDAIQTKDKGILACGYVYPLPPDTGSQDGWVLKVDSLGCISPDNCWVGNNEITIKKCNPDQPFIIFPNPASGKFSVEFLEMQGEENIAVYNILGVMQYQSHLFPDQKRIEINSENWSPGIYIVRVFGEDRLIGVEKVIIQ
jgi:hypothetical protein